MNQRYPQSRHTPHGASSERDCRRNLFFIPGTVTPPTAPHAASNFFTSTWSRPGSRGSLSRAGRSAAAAAGRAFHAVLDSGDRSVELVPRVRPLPTPVCGRAQRACPRHLLGGARRAAGGGARHARSRGAHLRAAQVAAVLSGRHRVTGVAVGGSGRQVFVGTSGPDWVYYRGAGSKGGYVGPGRARFDLRASAPNGLGNEC